MSVRQNVTITLGGTGQVVKREASDIGQSEYFSSSGGKRPIRERLGSCLDSTCSNDSESINKRQRRENYDRSNNKLNDRLVDQDDLRYKLLHKSQSGQNKHGHERNHADLREKLSRNVKVTSRFNGREEIPESMASGSVRRVAARKVDDQLHIDSLRRSYPPLNLDPPRHISPDRVVGSSRGISPPRSYTEMWPSVISHNPSRHPPYIPRSADVSRLSTYAPQGIDASRSTLVMSKSAPMEVSKPVLRVLPTSRAMQNSTYVPEQLLSVAGLLHSLGLEKYAILFQAEEVDMTALKQMGEHDLKDLGIPMGPRKKIILAVQSRRRHHP